MRVFRLILVLLAALALASATSPAYADEASDNYHAGKKLFMDGKYSEALPLFQSSLKASKSPNARLYVARCLEQLGRLPEAYDQMQKTVRVATARAENDAKYAATRDASAAELALLEPRVGKLVITVTGMEDGFDVQLDGELLEPSRLGVPVTVTTGTHDIVVTAPDHPAATTQIAVEGGSTVPVSLALDSSSDPETPVRPGGQDDGLGNVRIAGFVVAGVGVAGMAVFGVTAAMVSSKESQLADECGGRCTDPTYDQIIDDGKTLQLVANVSLGLGAAALLAGTAMIIFGGPSEDGTDEPSPSAELRIGPGFLSVEGRF